MSDLSQNYQSSLSIDSSQDHIPGKKYIKKSRINRIKVHKNKSASDQKKICLFYNRGACNLGSQCPLSHSFIPDIAKKICKFFLTNSCTKGQACSYSHNIKRYPCKFYHIQQHCTQGNQCKFSHEELDLEFEDEFLKDNQEFLLKLYKQQKNLSHKYLKYIENYLLQPKENTKQAQPAKQVTDLSLIFGFQTIKTVSRESNRNEQVTSSSKKYTFSKKSSNKELPFSIRITHKNRNPIPQRLDQIENGSKKHINNESNAGSQKLESSGKNQLQANIYDKISQDIQLTPRSKSQRFEEEIQYYMCSYN